MKEQRVLPHQIEPSSEELLTRMWKAQEARYNQRFHKIFLPLLLASFAMITARDKMQQDIQNTPTSSIQKMNSEKKLTPEITPYVLPEVVLFETLASPSPKT